MGDVLVYMDPPVNARLLAFARPLADAAGGALVALVASGEPRDADALAAADVVLEVVAPGALALPARSAPGGARGGDRGALAGPRRCSRTPRPATTSPPRRRPRRACRSSATASSCRCRAARREAVSAIYGGQLQATVRDPLPAVFAINSAALHEEPHGAGAGRARRSSRRPPSSTA